MDFSLSSSLVGSAVSNPDKLALDLQFATDKALTARKGPTPVFTRGSSATFVGSNGLIQSAGNDIARFDHDPVTLACKGLLIEESRTNASRYSGQLVIGTGWNANLTPSVTSIVDGLGPDGNNAYEVAEIANAGTHVLFNTGGTGTAGATSVVSGTTYTGSIFVKKVVGSVDWIQLSFSSVGFGTVQYANFDISNGTIGNFSSSSPQIQPAGNGWYRCSMSAAATVTTTTTSNLFLAFTNNTDTTSRLPSFAGNTANKILAAMCQFEAGAFPTSYIPTAASSVIRSADVCSISGSDFSNIWNGVDTTMFFRGSRIANQISQVNWELTSGASATSVTSDRGALTERIAANAVGIMTRAAFTTLTEYKIAAALKASDYAVSFNGDSAVTSSNAFVLTLSKMTIGMDRTNASQLNGWVHSIKSYKKRLSNAKLQALTV